VVHIPSTVEKRVRTGGGSRSATPYGPQDVLAEDHVEHRRQHQVQRYFRDVIRHLTDLDRLFVFGPGEAKGEFVKEVQENSLLGDKLVGTETADKMTDRQVVAAVRDYFTGLA